MPKKTRKQKQRSQTRRTPSAVPGGAGLPVADVEDEAPAEPEVVEAAVATPAATEATAAATDEVAAPVAVPASVLPVSPRTETAPASVPSGRRRVERLSPAASGPAATTQRVGRAPMNAAAMFAPLDPDDAAIPFDRVPYVPADLRRVAIMAGFMVLLIIVAAVVVSHIVT